jgi:hypothetical protein
MILVKRCHDNVVALLIILSALDISLALQKITLVISFISVKQAHKKRPKLTEGPSIPKGKVT